jgi:hypothetical protein
VKVSLKFFLLLIQDYDVSSKIVKELATALKANTGLLKELLHMAATFDFSNLIKIFFDLVLAND